MTRHPTLYEKLRHAYQAGNTTEQRRDDINSGVTPDKRPMNDPATAPLGTDNEAGGVPDDPGHIRQLRQSARPRQDSRQD